MAAAAPPGVLHIASEIFPLVKTGGLADVAGALPPAVDRLGVSSRVLLPGFPEILDDAVRLDRIGADSDLFGGGRARLYRAEFDRLAVGGYVLDCPGLYARGGNPYVGPDGADWPDNHRRFGALAWPCLALIAGADPSWCPSLIHGHDWQSGLAIAHSALRPEGAPARVISVHNLAYQGLFDKSLLPELGLPWSSFTPDGVEFHDRLSFLKAGLSYADRITTVSRTYAQEIQRDGFGLEGLLADRAADLVGIVNGIDTATWSPATDARIARTYDAGSLEGKAENKRALQRRLDLTENPGAPLFGLVSRFNRHKGIDLLLAAIDDMVAGGGQIAFLGSGDADLEAGLGAAAGRAPGAVGGRIGYDEALAHQIQAGADVILVPSRSEPCGLTQLYGLAYGTVPLVRRTGGLADTVIGPDGGAGMTGFVFDVATKAAFAGAVDQVFTHFGDRPAWRALQRRGMAEDHGWDRAARAYIEVYRACLA